jgi:hypothetical protein
MPGPKDFPTGSIVEDPPATGMNLDELVEDEDADPAEADEADGAGRFYAPGEAVNGS